MARTALPVTAVAGTDAQSGTGTVAASTTVIDQANGMAIGAGKAGLADRWLVVVNLTNGADVDVIFRAGVQPPAERAGEGDYTVLMDHTKQGYFEIESGRFAQADGSVNVDFGAGATGTIEVVQLLKGG